MKDLNPATAPSIRRCWSETGCDSSKQNRWSARCTPVKRFMVFMSLLVLQIHEGAAQRVSQMKNTACRLILLDKHEAFRYLWCTFGFYSVPFLLDKFLIRFFFLMTTWPPDVRCEMFHYRRNISVGSLRCHKATKHLFPFLLMFHCRLNLWGQKDPSEEELEEEEGGSW